MPVTLSQSVGRRGRNQPQDVNKVQALLNVVGTSPYLKRDKISGPKTIAAIEGFQAAFLTKPDGRVDPGGKTLRRLNELTDKGNWPLLYIVRRNYQGSDNWGTIHLMTAQGTWEKFCYSYELPWIEDDKGRSKSSKSRIKIGTYALKVRTDGAKGWRLELLNTGHRTYIQVHRAHKSMYIEGCLLPVHFNDFTKAGPQKGDQTIQTRSVALMQKIKARYDQLVVPGLGNPTLTISANLPAIRRTGKRTTAIA